MHYVPSSRTSLFRLRCLRCAASLLYKEGVVLEILSHSDTQGQSGVPKQVSLRLSLAKGKLVAKIEAPDTKQKATVDLRLPPCRNIPRSGGDAAAPKAGT